MDRSERMSKAMAAERTHDVPLRNSAMMASRSFCTISPCIEETVKLAARIFSVSQSTYKGGSMKMWRQFVVG